MYESLITPAPGASITPATGGAPDSLFDSLLWQESRGQQLRPDGTPVTSKKGAIGIAQVMPGTAPEAARLAGLDYDDLRYRTDAEYNKQLGRAYFNKQLEDFGDESQALAAYNAGPGAMRRALAAATKAGNPEGWLRFLPAETQEYVPAIMAKAGRVPGVKVPSTSPGAVAPVAGAPVGGEGEFFTPSRGEYASLITPPMPERSMGESAKDSAIAFGSGLASGVGALASAFGADNSVARGADQLAKDIEDQASPYRKELRQRQAAAIEAAEASGSTMAEIVANANVLLKSPVDTLLNAAGSTAPTILAAFLPGLGQANAARFIVQGAMGAAQGAGAVKGSIYEGVEREMIKRGVPPEEAAKVAAGAQAYDGKNQQQIALGAILGFLAGTTGAEGAAARIAGRGAAGEAGEAVAQRGVLGSAGMGALKEAPTEAAQGGQERLATNIALQNEGIDVPTWQGVAGNATLEGAAGGLLGGGFGGIEAATRPAMPPELKPVADQAAKPNSPVSRAAMAGNTPEARAQREAQAQQQTAAEQGAQVAGAPADPSARLAELEAIARGTPESQGPDGQAVPGTPSRYFTAEEKAEYDQLVQLRDATEKVAKAGQPEVKEDPIGARVAEIEKSLRAEDTLQQMRVAGEDTRGLLKDLAVAKSPSTNAAQREQALARAEYALGWIGERVTGPTPQPSDPIEAALAGGQLSQQDRESLLVARQAAQNPALPEATRRAAQDQAQEIVGRTMAPASAPAQGDQQAAPAVLGDIAPAAGSPDEALRQAERLERGAFQFRSEGFDSDAAELQQQADSAREEAATRRAAEFEAARVEDVPAPRVATPTGAGPAIIRRRRETLNQLVADGLDRVERRDDGYYLVSQTSKRQHKLESGADAQLARAAIADAIRAGAAQANTNPTQAQKEAGNYKVGEVQFDGLTLAIENPQGSKRFGTDPNGERWETTMPANYGYVRGSAQAADGDKVDIYLPDTARAGSPAWIIDQYNSDGSFDETKTVLGVATQAEALRIYDAGFSDGSGPSRRGAITPMPMEEFKSWVMSPAAKKPAGAPPQRDAGPSEIQRLAAGQLRDLEEATGKIEIRVDGKATTLQRVALGGLPARSKASTDGRGIATTKAQGKILSAVAEVFGKRVVFFQTGDATIGDGFVRPDDSSTIYLNATSTISPLAVFGHELTHLLKTDNTKAYAALVKVIGERIKPGAVDKMRRYYADDQILEEITSDLAGDMMSDPKFWSDVFDEVRDNGSIAAMMAMIRHYVAKLIKAIKQPGFGSADMVNDLEAVRVAVRDAMAAYARQTGASQAKIQAAALRAEKDVATADAQRSAARAAPAIAPTVDRGIHFSKQPRDRLDGRFFGAGMKGAEARRLEGATDPRIRERVYAYLDGRQPESGVGGYPHEVELRNLYDADADPLDLWKAGDLNASESAILDAGFDGYKAGGVGIQLGDAARSVAAKSLNGTVAEEVFRKGLMSNEIKQIVVGNIPGAQMRNGSLLVPARSREQANSEMARIGSSIRFSKQRLATARAEFEATEKRLRGIDGWMKAPNGQPTKLNERQWVHVRTPSFKRWFGDWEAAHAAGGVWAMEGVSKAVDQQTGEPLVLYHGTGRAGFATFEKPGGTKRGDLGIFLTSDRNMAASYGRRGRVRDVADGDLDVIDEDGEAQEVERFGGVYGLFLNVRNPNEDNFEGANWDGSRENQWVVEVGGEQQYGHDGRGYFTEEQAQELAKTFQSPEEEEAGSDSYLDYVRGADEHWNSTDSVVREARSMGSDGAIIREVIDEGGGPSSYYGVPADVYVAFDPNQVKSADFNDGAYSVSDDDIRHSRARAIPESVDDVTNVDAAFEFAGSRQFATNRDFKLALQQRAQEAAGAARVPLDGQDDRAEAYLVRVGARDARIGLRDNSNAIGWYNDKVTKALRLVSLIHPEIATSPESRFAFTWALAVTSNGMKVGKNFEMAEAAYEAYRRTGKMPTDMKAGQTQQQINAGLGLFNSLRDSWGLQELMHFATSKRPVRDIERATGISVTGEGKGTEVYGAAILGPKVGNGFFRNLYGQFDQLTMDRWLMRTWGRWVGRLVDVDRTQVKAKRDQLGGVIRMLSPAEKRAFEDALGDKLRLSDLDAVADVIAMSSAKPSLRESMNRVAPTTDAHVSRLDEVLGQPRKGQDRSSLGGELRKLGNTLARLLDGQIEAPAGVRQRDFIRKVFSGILADLQSEHSALTMADLQAVLWYPEKRLYDAAKATDDAADAGYSDDEAPDYANAASALAARKGVPQALISKTIKDVENELQATKRAAAAGRSAPGPRQDRDGAGSVQGGSVQSVVRDAGGVRGGDGSLALDSRPQQSDRGPDLAGLPAEVKVDGQLIRFGGFKPAQDAAWAYAAKAGIDYQPPTTYAKVDPARAKRIADAFEAMPHAPNDPEVKAAYRALIDETAAQYQAMLDTGIQVEFIGGPDPYGNPRNAILDVTRNNHLWIYPTTDGFGGSESSHIDISGNPLLEPTQFKISGRTALANDLFRAVHDYFGHIAEGVGFRADGEENTWRKHAAMFTPLARRALTTETRGQNSWVNYGPFAEHNKTANGGDTQYAPQKIGLLPEWVVEEGRTDSATDTEAINERIDALEDLIACLKK